MRNFKKTSIVSAAVCFALGIGYGVWKQKNRQAELSDATPLRVLCAENWVSEDVLRQFSSRNNVPVQLWTYSRPSEFLRQMANSDGKVDVICTSSMLLRSLIESHWLLKTDFKDLPNLQQVSVDFQKLAFDPGLEYSVPLFWNLYGFFAKTKTPPTDSWKQTWSTKRVALWGEELSLLSVMNRLGVRIEEKLEQEESKSLEADVKRFADRAVQIVKPELAPVSADNLLSNAEIAELPLGRVARLLGGESPYSFWLPPDGATLEIGLLAIGAKTEHEALAKELINDLLQTEHALGVHRRLGSGVVHVTLSTEGGIAPMQRAEALRQFPLTLFKFPDVSVEALPRFQKIYDQTLDRFK